MAMLLEKVYECLNKDCKQQIKLEKRAEGGWNKFNLDGSPHIHPRKGQQQQQQQEQTKFQESELANLEKKISNLEVLIRTLISQQQMTRQELGELKKRK